MVSVSNDCTTTVMWLVRLRIRYARPWARGRNRLIVGPLVDVRASLTHEAFACRAAELCSAFAMALASTLLDGSLAACGANLSTACASAAGRPRMRSTTRRAFIGRDAGVPRLSPGFHRYPFTPRVPRFVRTRRDTNQ